MQAPTIKTIGSGTINAIRKVWVDATSIKFALVLPDDGRCRLAVRIGLNTTADGNEHFRVGDRVKYTVSVDPAGVFARAQDLVKS